MKLMCLTVAAFMLAGCPAQPEPKNAVDNEAEKQEFFPVRSYLEGQVHLLDSLKVPITRYITVGNTTDSAQISPEECKSLAKEFLQPDISAPSLRKFYKENSFADQSIPSITLTYAATGKDLEIRRLDVLIRPDPVMNDKVRSIYMEKAIRHQDTAIFKKLYWKTNQEFQIVTTAKAGSLPATVTQLKVKWNNPEY